MDIADGLCVDFHMSVCVCTAYKKRDDKVDLLSNLLDKTGSEGSGHSDLRTV